MWKISDYQSGKNNSVDEIAASNLRVRTKHPLKNLGVRTVDELTALSATQIQQARNAGVNTLPDIQAFLAHRGKCLASHSLPKIPSE